MIYTIKRYFPNFFDVDESDRIVVPFETLEELFEIPFVKKWAEDSEFHKFALLSNGPSTAPRAKEQHYLMAQLKEGYEWWVIGILSHFIEGLPKHKALYGPEVIIKDNRIYRPGREFMELSKIKLGKVYTNGLGVIREIIDIGPHLNCAKQVDINCVKYLGAFREPDSTVVIKECVCSQLDFAIWAKEELPGKFMDEASVIQKRGNNKTAQSQAGK